MKASQAASFATEADLVAKFCDQMQRHNREKWTIYPETGGFDLLLVQEKTGVQLGLEAKMLLNLKVLAQALPGYEWRENEGPDYRGVLVPQGKVQHDLSGIARRLGLGVLTVSAENFGMQYFRLPDEGTEDHFAEWFPWLPTRQCVLPEYVPDVQGGKPAPLQLTHWKIQAIKLLILLDRRGAVTRRDMKALGLSQARWTQPHGYLTPANGVYVRSQYTPDFKAQHPTNWAQIEADFEKWAPVDVAVPKVGSPEASDLFDAVASELGEKIDTQAGVES